MVAMFVTLDLQAIFHNRRAGIFVTYLLTKLLVLSSNGSSVIAIKPQVILHLLFVEHGLKAMPGTYQLNAL
jgi:hypothetical protein